MEAKARQVELEDLSKLLAAGRSYQVKWVRIVSEEPVAGRPVPVLLSDAWLVLDREGKLIKRFKTRKV